ncbi:hypothetical protein [Agitococcus lubricus]|uniref:Uncharacterized protein n=1 Tax=Agitococcus lubricus TaxID=1077255 RepID=A0A2T5IZT3_9GAMM|nr:hypothetical protein [Agitococcus lubricus]PTQ89552.1 hypothetical protein C8N29_10683 [Agitococcus lubricus]
MVKNQAEPRIVISLWLVVLDVLGLAIMGVGIAEQLGRVHVLTSVWPHPYAGAVLMVIGVAFMLPLLLSILKGVQRVKQADQVWLQQLPVELQKKLTERVKNESRK